MNQGSSPRVRGKHPNRRSAVGSVRLIPACAGKTLNCFVSANTATAHPRVCGENRALGRGPWDAAGSSPRVRGKPTPMKINKPLFGLIPACAGKTDLGSAWLNVVPAHPRVCGENVGWWAK